MGRSQDSDVRETTEREDAEAASSNTVPATTVQLGRDAERPKNADDTTEKHHLSAPGRVAVLWRDHRPKVLVGSGTLLATVAGVALALVGAQTQSPQPRDTVPVTYQVTGEGKATVFYRATHTGEERVRERLVDLPWTEEVHMTADDGTARVSIVLDEDGGKAQCAVAVAGRHRQRATAFGDFGRATCSAKVPDKGTAAR